MKNAQYIANWLTEFTNQDWELTQDDPGRCYLTRKSDGLKLILRSNFAFDELKPNQRIEIGGGSLRYLDGRYFTGRVKGYANKEPSISVNSSRPPEAIAKDIIRRLLPDLERWYDLAKKEIAEQDKHTQRRQQTADLINKTFDAKPSYHTDTVHKWVQGGGAWEAQITTDGINKLTFTQLDVETAMDMIQLFENMQKENLKTKGLTDGKGTV